MGGSESRPAGGPAAKGAGLDRSCRAFLEEALYQYVRGADEWPSCFCGVGPGSGGVPAASGAAAPRSGRGFAPATLSAKPCTAEVEVEEHMQGQQQAVPRFVSAQWQWPQPPRSPSELSQPLGRQPSSVAAQYMPTPPPQHEQPVSAQQHLPQQPQRLQLQQVQSHQQHMVRVVKPKQPLASFLDVPNAVPTDPGVERLDPETVLELLWSGQCQLVDVRGNDRAAGLIEGTVHVPAISEVPFTHRVPELVQRWRGERLVVFTCQFSAHRAPQCANWYRREADPAQRVAILSGGFRGWEGSGLPVLQARPQGSSEAAGAAVISPTAADAHALQQGFLIAAGGGAHVSPQASWGGRVIGGSSRVMQPTGHAGFSSTTRVVSIG